MSTSMYSGASLSSHVASLAFQASVQFTVRVFYSYANEGSLVSDNKTITWSSDGYQSTDIEAHYSGCRKNVSLSLLELKLSHHRITHAL